MKKNLLLLAVISFLFSISLKAQDNVVKLNMGGLLGLKLSLNYERVVNDKSSFSIYLDYKVPRSRNFGFIGGTEDGTGEADSKVKVTGFSISPEYRFYTSSSKDAPQGFFVAPYLKYSQTKYAMTGVVYTDGGKENEGELDAFWKCFGGGIQLGYQWIINDQLSIDFAFFGVGVDRNVIGADIIPNDESVDLEKMAKDINADVDEIPFIGSKIKAEAKDDKVVVKAPFLFPNLRGAISIGYAF